MPGHKPRAIGRSNNRIDADSMVRFLQRKVPNGAFYVIFDPEETCPIAPLIGGTEAAIA
jgi:hypothetical protein